MHTFLSGAKSRLLPASVPFRFFGAACVYHVLAWVALFAGADQFPHFSGGLGWPLAALHLITLGVLTMTAMGASLQLLPVATRQPVFALRAPAVIWWIYTPGVAALALGMGTGQTLLLTGGATSVVAGLAVYGALLAHNLYGARGMPNVIAHGWVALASLAVLLVTALSLAYSYGGVPILTRPLALALHVPFAAYGFMGMLVLGFSCVLVPMFALSPAIDERSVLVSCIFAAIALLGVGVAAFGIAPARLRIAALVVGSVAVVVHLRLMRHALATGLRRSLGGSFMLVRIAWGLLVASLLAALGIVLELPMAGLPTLFGMLLVAGWLLTILVGLLQRILPFLASMHAIPGSRRPPTPSTLTAPRPLAIHFYCHLAALCCLAVATMTDSPNLTRTAAVTGLAGALAFAAFFALVLWRRRHPVAMTPVRTTSVA
ncbi:MAG: hypothetical protein ABI777_06740 [Betaproteobacteria bacterium]